MSDRSISLFLDEDVAGLVATLLSARGYHVTTVWQIGRSGYSDEEQLAFATQQGMTLVTHNRVHYEVLAAQWFESELNHCGIVIARRRPVYELCRRLVSMLEQVTPDLLANQLRYI